LFREWDQSPSRESGNKIVLVILDQADECADASRTLTHDDPKFRKMGSQSVD